MNETQRDQILALGEDPRLVIYGTYQIGAAPPQDGWWFVLTLGMGKLFLGATWDIAIAKLAELVDFANKRR